MKEITNTMLSSGISVVMAFAIWVLYALVGMPTTARMNKFMMASLLATAVVMFAARVTGFKAFARLAQIYWGVVVIGGALAFLTMLFCIVWKFQVPVISLQGYGVLILMALIGVWQFLLATHAFGELERANRVAFDTAGEGQPA